MPDPIRPPPKRAPARPYQRPTATGPGADACRQVIRRCNEVAAAVRGDVMRDLPVVAANLVVAAKQVIVLANAQLGVLQQFQTATAVLDAQNRQLAMAAAKQAIAQSGRQFANVPDRSAAVETQAQQLLADEAQRQLNMITAAREGDDRARIDATLEAIQAAQLALEKAEFAHAMDIDTSIDTAFMQRAEALRQKMLSQPYFDQPMWALTILQQARRLGDDERARLIVYALRPAMISETADQVAARRQAVARGAGRSQAAGNALAAATQFISISDQVAAQGSPSHAIARECIRQLEQCFLRTGGRDLADPASVTAGKFGSLLTSQRALKLSEPLAVGDSWVTRAVRAKAHRPLSPWSENVAFAPRAGKAAQ